MALVLEHVARFVDGDQARATALIEALLATRGLLSPSACERQDPQELRRLLRASESHVLHLVVFSLAYEFDRPPMIPADRASRQALLILNALDERVEDSEILFPKFELLPPEEAALVAAADEGELSLFPSYMELLYAKSTANIELADKKQRIADKIDALTEALGAVYLRGRGDDGVDLCRGVAVLADNADDALMWATADDVRGPERAIDARELELTVAVTNHSQTQTIVVSPMARAWVEFADGEVEVVEVRDVLLGSEPSIDNNVAPGTTRVRSYIGNSELDGRRACALELTVRADGRKTTIVAADPPCGAPGSDLR